MPTDFPEPVVPATIRCGMRARSTRLARDVLAKPQCQQRMALVVDGRTENLGEFDDLPAWIRQLEPHQVLAGNRLDNTNRYQRQSARQVFRKIDDLAAFDADCSSIS